MVESKMCIKYMDDRPIFIPRLKYYPGGISLPNKENIITVTEGERKNFLRLMNGDRPCWEDVKEPTRRRASIESEV